MVEARNPLSGSNLSLASLSSSSSMAGTTTTAAAAAGGGSGAAGPSSASAGDTTPMRLKTLEMHDCTSLGQDVIKWLKDRIENVVCTDLTYER